MNTWVRTIIAVIIFGAVAAGSTSVSIWRFNEAKQERIAAEESDEITVDSVYDDRIRSGLDPNYDPATYQDLAKDLESDPIHVDDYLAFDVDDEGLEAIRGELEGLDVPIYVAFINHTQLDDTDANLDLKAARIAHELDSDGATVLVVSPFGQGIGSKEVERDIRQRPEPGPDDTLTTTGLAWVQALKNAQPQKLEAAEPLVAEDNSDDSRELSYSPVSAISGAIFGLVVGGVIALIGVAGWGYWRRERGGLTSGANTRSVNHRNRRK